MCWFRIRNGSTLEIQIVLHLASNNNYGLIKLPILPRRTRSVLTKLNGIENSYWLSYLFSSGRNPTQQQQTKQRHNTQPVSDPLTMATGVPTMAAPVVPAANPTGGPPITWEDLRSRLLDPKYSVSLQAAKDIRERIDAIPPSQTPAVLVKMIPAFTSVLSRTTRPNPDTSSNDHRIRNAVLEILSRMPMSEMLRPQAPGVVAAAMEVLAKDYEDNALLASKIFLDLHKNYRPMPQEQVQPYLDFVQLSYRSLPTSVQRNFLFTLPPAVPVKTPVSAKQQRTPTPRSSATPAVQPLTPVVSKATGKKLPSTPASTAPTKTPVADEAGVEGCFFPVALETTGVKG